MHVLTVFGTRPEAIKMAPVVRRLEADANCSVTVCVTGQHREMLDQTLQVFGIEPDVDLNVMRQGQTLTEVTCAVISQLATIIPKCDPDLILVHGDTTTSFAAALAGFYARLPVGHVEAGLRTHDMNAPWPEEMNRVVIARLARLHFAASESARDNLLAELVPAENIVVTGNTVIDALHWTIDAHGIAAREALTSRFSFLREQKRIVLVTGHRRENLDGGIERICQALVELAARGDVSIVYPVHKNPKVIDVVERVAGTTKNIHLIDPLNYTEFVSLMAASTVIISDSGGIQEEAPSLGVPVLITREKTERPEAVECGAALIVGTDTRRIVLTATALLDDPKMYSAMSTAVSPFGDGNAAERIVAHLRQLS